MLIKQKYDMLYIGMFIKGLFKF
ncbi:hypothetical protein BN1325_530003 [Staphylococcus aureus]|nr:hypothetical protein SAET23_580003 [Staphylococcus aureus]CRI29898.1 hypothetical protein BN1325_530003 [Staphylococcus aureus]CRI30021.1 hypothetical protein SAET23_580003 [Staphylococcus aureus]CRI31774.1 hypothetical protein BN1325_530003 [Staphylococcus aureus]